MPIELLDVTHLNFGLTQFNLAQADKPELFDKAAATLATLVEKFPESKQTAQALYYQGESLYARGKKAEAAKAYGRLVDKYPTATQRPDALYALVTAQEELGLLAEAGASYDKFLKDFGQHPLRAEVIMRRAETLFAQKQFPAAEKWFASAAAAKDFALADQAQLRHRHA